MSEDPPGAFDAIAQATLFGYAAVPAHVRVTARTSAWRVGGALRTLALFTVVAPFAAIFPPHAVWPIGALATGATLARRRWIERFTLQAVDGACPKCGHPLQVKPARLRMPHPVPCDACHHEVTLRLPPEVLAAHELA